MSDNLATALLNLEIRPGDRVAVSLGNCIEYAVVSMRYELLYFLIYHDADTINQDRLRVLQDRCYSSSSESCIHTFANHFSSESYFGTMPYNQC